MSISLGSLSMLWDAARLHDDALFSRSSSSSTASEDLVDCSEREILDVDESPCCQFASMECIRGSSFTVLADVGFFSPDGSNTSSEVPSPPALADPSSPLGFSMMFEKIFPISGLQVMRRISNPPAVFSSSSSGQGLDGGSRGMKVGGYEEQEVISEATLYYIINVDRRTQDGPHEVFEHVKVLTEEQQRGRGRGTGTGTGTEGQRERENEDGKRSLEGARKHESHTEVQRRRERQEASEKEVGQKCEKRMNAGDLIQKPPGRPQRHGLQQDEDNGSEDRGGAETSLGQEETKDSGRTKSTRRSEIVDRGKLKPNPSRPMIVPLLHLRLQEEEEIANRNRTQLLALAVDRTENGQQQQQETAQAAASNDSVAGVSPMIDHSQQQNRAPRPPAEHRSASQPLARPDRRMRTGEFNAHKASNAQEQREAGGFCSSLYRKPCEDLRETCERREGSQLQARAGEQGSAYPPSSGCSSVTSSSLALTHSPDIAEPHVLAFQPRPDRPVVPDVAEQDGAEADGDGEDRDDEPGLAVLPRDVVDHRVSDRRRYRPHQREEDGVVELEPAEEEILHGGGRGGFNPTCRAVGQLGEEREPPPCLQQQWAQECPRSDAQSSCEDADDDADEGKDANMLLVPYRIALYSQVERRDDGGDKHEGGTGKECSNMLPANRYPQAFLESYFSFSDVPATSQSSTPSASCCRFPAPISFASFAIDLSSSHSLSLPSSHPPRTARSPFLPASSSCSFHALAPRPRPLSRPDSPICHESTMTMGNGSSATSQKDQLPQACAENQQEEVGKEH
eukprot:756131-Hanusia_phi.AAC.1